LRMRKDARNVIAADIPNADRGKYMLTGENILSFR